MSQHQATIHWTRHQDEKFTDSRYSRAHTWAFDGGVRVPASSALSSVPLPYSKAENVDPEEALVAAASSCHMLAFLYLAAKAGLVVDSYEDAAVGAMSRNSRGRLAITSIQLSPEIMFSGARCPSESEVSALHHEAHEECYIANSISSDITVTCKWRFEGEGR
jgi:organic hydroperoxide reductase OsmC/OhrA